MTDVLDTPTATPKTFDIEAELHCQYQAIRALEAENNALRRTVAYYRDQLEQARAEIARLTQEEETK